MKKKYNLGSVFLTEFNYQTVYYMYIFTMTDTEEHAHYFQRVTDILKKI